ncbi:MAG: hypothetical protein EBV75_04350, partial [Acidimicrobiia bacterium]|nr:hypothetical protein [Acidimicrobiia bacterium]
MPIESFFVTRSGYLSDQPPVARINSVRRHGFYSLGAAGGNRHLALYRMKYFDIDELQLEILQNGIGL